MLADLTGRTALVTGGGQGLGLGIVERMAGQGADIIIADLNDENAAAAVARVEELGSKGYAVHMDVTDQQSISEGVSLAYDAAGQDRHPCEQCRCFRCSGIDWCGVA